MSEIHDSIESGLITRNNSYCFRYTYNNKKRRFTFGSSASMTLNQARLKVQHFKQELLMGRDPQREKDIQKAISFAELADEFKIKHCETLRETTRIKYLQIINTELLPKLQEVPITGITKKQVLSILDEKAYDQGSPYSANYLKAIISKIFNFAISRDYLEYNVIGGLKNYSTGPSRDRFYSEKEIKEIWKHLLKLREPTAQIFMMLFLTGQRKGETKKMEWKDVDLQNKVWTIPSHIAKNHTKHHVPLSSGAAWVLKYLKNGVSKDSPNVFPSNYGDSKGPIKTLQSSADSIKKNTSVKDFRPHDIRRTVATYLAKLRTDRMVISKILNHSDSSVTGIYDRHDYQKEKREALEKWYNYLSDIIK